MKLRPITGLTLRRAVFGTLFRAGRPMTAVEVVAALHAAGVTTSPMLVKPPALVIADVLAHQVRAGRVRRTSRGHYAVIAASMSRSTQWRCLHWRDRLEGA